MQEGSQLDQGPERGAIPNSSKHQQDMQKLNEEIQTDCIYLPGAAVTLECSPSCSEMLYYSTWEIDESHMDEQTRYHIN